MILITVFVYSSWWMRKYLTRLRFVRYFLIYHSLYTEISITWLTTSCYTLSIYRFVRSSRLRVEAHGEASSAKSACYNKEFRIAQSGCIVGALIAALHVPLFTVIYLKRSGTHVPYPVSFTVVMIFWFRYCVNWIIFGALNEQYKKAVVRLGHSIRRQWCG